MSKDGEDNNSKVVMILTAAGAQDLPITVEMLEQTQNGTEFSVAALKTLSAEELEPGLAARTFMKLAFHHVDEQTKMPVFAVTRQDITSGLYREDMSLLAYDSTNERLMSAERKIMDKFHPGAPRDEVPPVDVADAGALTVETGELVAGVKPGFAAHHRG